MSIHSLGLQEKTSAMLESEEQNRNNKKRKLDHVLPCTNSMAKKVRIWTQEDHFSPLHAHLDTFMMSYYDKEELDSLYRVSTLFRKLVIQECEHRCKRQAFIPQSLPGGVNYKNFFVDRFPNRIDTDFIRKNIGEIDEVPLVPVEFIERAKPGFKLIFIPEYITIELDENSAWELDESTAINGKKAKLIENPDSPLIGTKRKIKIPLTLNNIIFLFQRCIPEFEGMQDAWENILDQQGNNEVGLLHWSYQKEDPFGLGKSECMQAKMIREAGLKYLPLTDRILFHLLSYMRTGQFLQTGYSETTATTILDYDGTRWKLSLYWRSTGPYFSLNQGLYGCSCCSRGAAVGMSQVSS